MFALSRRMAISVILPLAAGLSPLAALGQDPSQMPPPAVTVVTLHAQDVALTTTLPGRVTASAEAEVRPQVNGIVTERLFEEGSHVKVGDPLFRIDATTYQAAVAQAEAAVAQARAQAEAARREAERVGALRDRRVASESTTDNAIAARDSAEAAVKVAEAQLQTARIELERTTIRAELDGVIGLAQTSQGALVTASQPTPLAVIRKLDPVHVDVTQSAAELIRFRREMAAQDAEGQQDRKVTLRLADGTQYGHEGRLTAAEPYVNETTGVVTLRLSFANPDGILLPGMYVQAVVQQATARNVILAPQEGVTRDRRGQPVALVANADNAVEQRPLTILQDMGNSWIVGEGLNDGDRIIVEGLQKIGPGMTVAPEERQAAAPAAAEGGAAPDAGEPTPEAADTGEQPAPEAGEAEQPATQPEIEAEAEAEAEAEGQGEDAQPATEAGAEQPAN
ncbi:efflux RND transporter periplasmic adaptor subunit [Paracoccus denitrificans]|jgi:membrane fusion protein (multidrug efflux system)|uniref:Efflux transporter, RND family, MFP subunit n=1 Tax=Paracoccus denitrificans (strain Pd 1222) TaxID=318586 RepID=A1B2Y3_PARDP|nr:efflux RND transporter periplasmic adaptor subunit [Paracoccus denitrificans]ABL69877.1 efflux transporter, RND family, MFP subunit [Paracoccus denitrificans PD1222]MBB4626958.1 membrane fusion protein (multidrug efflux system) [Paracoccus denitrificans]WQO33804.1 efflux RND transporter periplasmic adaptor subunit [Paracoccus denitrificans]SDI18298.1 membrane fusion protein, multidrug efflux system [Paracoccus denitrificans]SFQ99140.1 membrane fusion protein, multidrug efflux system [Paraco